MLTSPSPRRRGPPGDLHQGPARAVREDRASGAICIAASSVLTEAFATDHQMPIGPRLACLAV